MSCPKHPKYKAVLAPKCDCFECWDFYQERAKATCRDFFRRYFAGETEDE
jgi:hypothetical protein